MSKLGAVGSDKVDVTTLLRKPLVYNFCKVVNRSVVVGIVEPFCCFFRNQKKKDKGGEGGGGGEAALEDA